MANKKEAVDSQTVKGPTIKMEWTWRAHMASLIRFIEMGDEDNRQFAFDELMKLADQLDVVSPIKQEPDEEVKNK